MRPNPVLKRLGLLDEDRVVVIHCDDIGMCQASVAAFEELHETGIVSSGAVMVPCPWFLAAKKITRKFPQIDLGVHLTLTSEWSEYRWGPISTRDPASGMIDNEGYFFATSKEAQANIEPDFANVELAMQIARMSEGGFVPSHIDTHMGTVAHPKLMLTYIELAITNKLALMMFRLDTEGWMATGLDSDSAIIATELVTNLEDMGIPLFDHIRSMPLDDSSIRLDMAKAIFKDLPFGLTHFIIHPAIDTPEIRRISPDWLARVGDYEVFNNEALRAFIRQQGIHVIGYRQLQKMMPGFSD